MINTSNIFSLGLFYLNFLKNARCLFIF